MIVGSTWFLYVSFACLAFLEGVVLVARGGPDLVLGLFAVVAGGLCILFEGLDLFFGLHVRFHLWPPAIRIRRR